MPAVVKPLPEPALHKALREAGIDFLDSDQIVSRQLEIETAVIAEDETVASSELNWDENTPLDEFGGEVPEAARELGGQALREFPSGMLYAVFLVGYESLGFFLSIYDPGACEECCICWFPGAGQTD